MKKSVQDEGNNDKALASFGRYKKKCTNCGKFRHKASKCRASGQENKMTEEAPATTNNNKMKKVVDRNNVTCFNCQKKGHFANECRSPKKQTQSSNVANSSMNDTVLMTFPSTTMTAKTWIADSGASSHITNDDTGLYDVQEVKEPVKIGDGKTVYATKIGKLNVTTALKDGR